MQCPNCSESETKVIDSRLLTEKNSIRRRRQCLSCEFRFTTYENFTPNLPLIIKSDGRREPFEHDKIMRGLKKACQKRPISVNQLYEIINSVEKMLRETEKAEVESKLIGEKVVEDLYRLDPVSYIRFASFYWDFRDIEDFVISLKSRSHDFLPNDNKLFLGNKNEQH